MKRTILAALTAVTLLAVPFCAECAESGLAGWGLTQTTMETDQGSSEAFITIDTQNDDVKLLQEKLVAKGFLNDTVDGYFGMNSQAALKEFQRAVGLNATGSIASREAYDRILWLLDQYGVNLIWDGRFEDPPHRWKKWGKPSVREIVEVDGQKWLHLVTTGEKWQGLMQRVKNRSGNASTPELKAGQIYTLSFRAYGSAESVDKVFTCGFHNDSLADSTVIQEQFWSPFMTLTAEPQVYTYSFVPSVDGTFRIMIGTGLPLAIEAWYTDLKLEVGPTATAWTPAP